MEREQVASMVAQYLIETGDEAIWLEARRKAVRELHQSLPLPVIALHLGLSVRTVYRSTGRMLVSPDGLLAPLFGYLKVARTGPEVTTWYSRRAGRQVAVADVVQWLDHLVSLGRLDRQTRARRSVYMVSGGLVG